MCFIGFYVVWDSSDLLRPSTHILELHQVWKVVTDIAKFRSDGKFHEAVGGIRGLTAVPCPSNPKQDSILCCWNPNSASHSWILRMDPSDDGNLKPPLEESSIRKLAKAYLGTEDLHYSIGAYNDMLPTTFGTQRGLVVE